MTKISMWSVLSVFFVIAFLPLNAVARMKFKENKLSKNKDGLDAMDRIKDSPFSDVSIPNALIEALYSSGVT